MQNIDDLFQELKKDVVGQKAEIILRVNNIDHQVTSTDIIGNCLQDWLKSWFENYQIDYRVLENTQEFPDYFVTLNGVEYMIEVKSWNSKRNPAFDLANVQSYIHNIQDQPDKLKADYIVFAYEFNEDTNIITIKDIYKKKIYELAGKNTSDELKIQWKKKVAYNIRPINFHRSENTSFNNYGEFLIYLRDALKGTDQGDSLNLESWYNNLPNEYKNN